MAATVCADDPRTVEQRRSDAMTDVFSGAQTLACTCAAQDCPAAGTTPTGVIVHVVASADTLADDTAAQLDGSPRTRCAH
ncbi:DUF222 domain-containing protein [Mycobacterium sp. B14F4]|uniref:DUF222 domain-containing protein n=1 Tax=Mycobacterium sp. B14F4 TaxID=3153565 RepID=UPI00325DCA24